MEPICRTLLTYSLVQESKQVKWAENVINGLNIPYLVTEHRTFFFGGNPLINRIIIIFGIPSFELIKTRNSKILFPEILPRQARLKVDVRSSYYRTVAAIPGVGSLLCTPDTVYSLPHVTSRDKKAGL